MPYALTFSGVVEKGVEPLKLASLPAPPALNDGEVLLKTLAAPINPIDLLVFKGRYPVKPKSFVANASIAGYDGLLEVVESRHAGFKAGDHVMPREHGFGTWRSYAVAPGADVLRVPHMDPKTGAILKLGACPAYLLLEDASPALKPGDWVIQNGATSVIAQLVVQFARLRGVNTISIVRDRPAEELERVKAYLEGLGAGLVLTEGQLESGEMKAALEGKRIVMALDCVFGPSGQRMAELLAPFGTFINFGLLSGPASQLSITSDLIFFRALTFKPFRGSKALAARSDEDIDRLLGTLADLFATGKVKIPELDVSHWTEGDKQAELETKLKTAVEKAQNGATEIGIHKTVILFS